MDYFSNLHWEDMCGPIGLQTWNETSKDIGVCFQELFLQVPVYFLTAAVSSYYVGYKRDWVIREKTQENLLVFRSFVVLALVFTPIIQLYVSITTNQKVIYPVDYLTECSACIAWLVHFGYILALKHRLGPSPRGPTLLLFLWSIAMTLNIVCLRSSILAGEPIGFVITRLCCHILYLVSLIPSSSDSRPTYYSRCLVGSQHGHSEYTPLLPNIDEGVLGTAMQDCSWLSKLTFYWVNPLFDKGLQNKLTDIEELFDIPDGCRSSYISSKIEKALIGNVDQYQRFEEVPHQPFISSGYGSTGQTSASVPVTPTSRLLVRSASRYNVSLLRGLHSCFALEFYSIGILKLFSDMAGFVGPMLLNRLVTFVDDESIDMHYGYLYAAGLIGAALVSAVFNAHFNWMMSLVGLKMQTAIISTILRKTLSVTSTELSKAFSVGEITNFMSTDTDRIVNSCPSFHALWSIPLQLFITLFLLYHQVGLSFLAGVAFSIFLIPINKLIANKIGQLSTLMMKHKDDRVSLMDDLLKGIRTVKMNVWEDYFINKVTESRCVELRYLRGRKYLDALCVVLWATTPVLVAALTLGTHALRGATLDAPTVFTTVALINMLIAPLNAFPWVLNGLTEAWVSIKRIQQLLNLPDMDPERYYDRLNINNDEDNIIIIKNATFTWAAPRQHHTAPTKSKKNKGKSKKKTRPSINRDSSSSTECLDENVPFSLRDISLEIGRGQFIGVTGNVGGGKSSLLLAIIGEMIKKGGDLQIPDNLDGFGYVPQKPWLIRGTIRDNILFGKPYDELKYKTVVDACALTEDLNTLGWSAKVGEDGCMLSGGQRARISLARAVYQSKQVYLIDDVLSSVDAHVCRDVVQRCIVGALQHTTRIVISHQPHVLARAHSVIVVKNGRIATYGPPESVLQEMEDFPAPLPTLVTTSGPEPCDETEQDLETRVEEPQEHMAEGSVSWWVICMYIRSVGIALSVAIFLSLVLMQLSQNFTFIWLTFWLKNRTKNSTTVQLLNPVIHETNTLLDHGFAAADNFVHSLINKTESFIHGLGVKKLSTTDSEVPLIGDKSISPADMYYLEMYFGLAGLNLLFTIMRAFLFAYGGVHAATKIHKLMLKVVVKAKVSFFDTTPSGRILNRFSSDTYTVDDSLPFILNILLAQLFGLIGGMSVSIYGLPWVGCALVPLCLWYGALQRRYRASSRQLKRLHSTARAPIYTHFNDTLQGGIELRAASSNRTCVWVEYGLELVERWCRAGTGAAGAAGWLSLRLGASAAVVLAAAAAAVLLQRATHTADPGLVGLAISYTLSMTSMVGGVMSAFTETEREMIAVERIGEYIREDSRRYLKSCQDHVLENADFHETTGHTNLAKQPEIECEKVTGASPPYGWPSQGVISFEDVVLKYSGRESAALSHVSWSSGPHEKVGVAGRTGAGKSTLVAVLLRTCGLARGDVLVDNVPIHTLHLHSLRSRISVIPQEPFIFSGTVRENVDPLSQYSDAEIVRALERSGAHCELKASATTLSRGAQQLLCVARAVLARAKDSRRYLKSCQDHVLENADFHETTGHTNLAKQPEVVLIDEATANVDAETERIILDTLKTVFHQCTVVLVAHKLGGVLECDRALVLGDGKVLEFDEPNVLLSNPTSHLYQLVHAQQH